MASNAAKAGMWGGRFLGLTVLLLLLTEPLIKTTATVYEKPLVAVLADNSQSMLMSANGKTETEMLREVMKALPAELADKADLKLFALADGIKVWSDSSAFDGSITDLSGSFDQLASGFSGMNLAAVVLLSDGLFNRGDDPLNAVRRLKSPVYCVPFGDTMKRNDIVLSKIKHNRTAYIGNDFPIELGVDVNGFKGRNIKITVSEDESVLSALSVSPKSNRQYFSIPLMLRAQKKGLHAYTVKIESLPGEFSVLNNTRTIYIEVLDSKQKILFLARGPHPDIAAMRQILESAEVYETVFANADDFRGGFDGYSLVVLHRLPDAASRNKPWFNNLAASQVPRLVIAGDNISSAEFNQLQQVMVYAPSRANPNEVAPILNKDFRLFNTETSWPEMMNEWSPLSVPFGSWNLTNGSEALFRQKIGSVSTADPLVAFGEPNGIRMGVIAGEGFWRWRLSEYAASGKNDVFRSLVSKIFQFLSAKKDTRPFFVSSKQIFQQGEDLLFDASLVNESGERVVDAEIKMLITSSSGKSYPFFFSPASIGYRLNAGRLPSGKYAWQATVKLGEKVYVDKGSFSISDLNLESMNLTADHGLLDAVSAASGGKILKRDAKEIARELIKSNKLVSVAREEKSVKDLIDLKWLFFLMLACFSLEWFLRRYSGAY